IRDATVTGVQTCARPISNGAAAEIGRFNGGVVNLTTKSGTNEFHGTAFEFSRNEALNARNLFAPRTASSPDKPLFRRNQFGFVQIGRASWREKRAHSRAG